MSAESSYVCRFCGREFEAIPPNNGVCLSCDCMSQESYEKRKDNPCFLPSKVGVPVAHTCVYCNKETDSKSLECEACCKENKARNELKADRAYLDLSKLQPAQRLSFYRRVCKDIEYVPVRDYNAIPNGTYTPAYWRAKLKYQKSVAAAVAALKDHPGGFAP